TPELAIRGLARVFCKAQSIVMEDGVSWVKQTNLVQRARQGFMVESRRPEGKTSAPWTQVSAYPALGALIGETISRIDVLLAGGQPVDLHEAHVGMLRA